MMEEEDHVDKLLNSCDVSVSKQGKPESFVTPAASTGVEYKTPPDLPSSRTQAASQLAQQIRGLRGSQSS